MNKISKKARIIITLIMIVICVICLLPIVAIISISVSEQSRLIKEGYSLLPRGFSLDGYAFVFKDMEKILRAYRNSIIRTAIGTGLGLLMNSLFAYVLSRPKYRYRTALTIFLTIPMVLNAGLVPTYLVYTQYLHMKDSWAALIMPLAVVPWYIILMRTFFNQIPYELSEAARIDGAGEWRIYWNIVLPLAKPALATVGMFLALSYWNDWWYPMLYIETPELITLQHMLSRMMKDVIELANAAVQSGLNVSIADLPTEVMRMAMCMVAAGPMLFIFPFFQKYFVKGLTVGGVKG